MPLHLTNLADDQVPIEFAGLTPAALARMSLAGIRRLRVRRGNRETALGELFQVTGDSADLDWLMEGDCRHVHGLGTGIDGGTIVAPPADGKADETGVDHGRRADHGAAAAWFANAAKRLRLSTLGFFQYLAPSVQLGLAVLAYGEPFTAVHALTFGCIWAALALYTFDARRALHGR